MATAEPTPAATADLILVADAEPWLMAAACPALPRLRTGDAWPLLLTVGREPGRATQDFLNDLASKSALMLLPDGTHDPLPAMAKQVKSLGRKPLAATSALAAAIWGHADQVVAAACETSDAVILGAAWAARRGVPLLVYDPADRAGALRDAVVQLGAGSVLVVGQDRAATDGLRGVMTVESISCAQVQDRLAAELGVVARTVIVARTPDASNNVGRTAWLAPYLSVVRGAPILLVGDGKAVAIEREVDAMIDRHGLRPRSITLLGDYDSLRVHKVTTDVVPREGGKPSRLTVEPCMPSSLEMIARFGVGRIPLADLEPAALLVARGLGRARLLAGRRADLLMLANAALEEWQLPLCEVVSQATAAEFKNFGIATREFYRIQTDQPEVVAAADTAQLIVFQGHTEHQLLVGKRSALADGDTAPDGQARHWSGAPVVILQTCVSLKSEAFRQLHELGGTAMIGTGSPIHSASGSGFMKAMADSMLYRGSRLGEALRDARNYFACLMELKKLRGHTEQAKVERTALSFRLWGDPELELFPQGLPAPMLAPLAAEVAGPDRLLIRPARRELPEVRNEEYRVRLQPGAELAGMVVRGSSGLRRVLELYFFRLPLPEGFTADQYGAWTVEGDDAQRGVVRVDPRGRLLYVLYFPEPSAARRSFALQGVKRPPVEKPLGQ